MKKIIIIILAVLIIVTGFFFATREKKNPNELTLYGNIEIRQVDLSFRVPGKIEKMLKEEGDKVEKGELMAILDTKDYIVNLKKANAETERTLALKKDAEAKFKRQAPLTSDNTLSKQDYDTLLNSKDKAKADYDMSLATLEDAQNQLEYTKIYAPEEGTVTVRVQEPGANVAKDQIVYTISKTTPVWIRAYVNETDLGNIKYGDKATIYTDTQDPKTGKNRTWEGHIGYISPVAEFTPKTVQSTDLRTDLVYRIRIYVDNVDDYLRQGMPVTIKINLKTGVSTETDNENTNEG